MWFLAKFPFNQCWVWSFSQLGFKLPNRVPNQQRFHSTKNNRFDQPNNGNEDLGWSRTSLQTEGVPLEKFPDEDEDDNDDKDDKDDKDGKDDDDDDDYGDDDDDDDGDDDDDATQCYPLDQETFLMVGSPHWMRIPVRNRFKTHTLIAANKVFKRWLANMVLNRALKKMHKQRNVYVSIELTNDLIWCNDVLKTIPNITINQRQRPSPHGRSMISVLGACEGNLDW